MPFLWLIVDPIVQNVARLTANALLLKGLCSVHVLLVFVEDMEHSLLNIYCMVNVQKCLLVLAHWRKA